jgi:hypothetical protein
VKLKTGKKGLAKGQLWKTGAASIEIVGLGKTLIHYRVTKVLGARGVSAQISEIEPMQNYLRFNRARLVRDGLTG